MKCSPVLTKQPRIERHDYLHGHGACQVGRSPSGAAEEIVIAVEGMPLVSVQSGIGLNGLKDGKLSSS